MAKRASRKRNQAARTEYTPKNPGKYRGEYPIWMRSRWEIGFAINCDMNPAVIAWASEPLEIPYFNPLTRKQTVYVPDFMVQVVKQVVRNGQKVPIIETMLIEIKPAHETYITEARNPKDAALVIKNKAKWAAATAWCRRHGAEFKVLTEKDLFIQAKKDAKKAPAKKKAAKKKT